MAADLRSHGPQAFLVTAIPSQLSAMKATQIEEQAILEHKVVDALPSYNTARGPTPRYTRYTYLRHRNTLPL